MSISGPNDHVGARQVVFDAWRSVHGRDPTPNELLLTQAIAHLETLYGRGGQFAQWAAEGDYNWGALEGPRGANGACPSNMRPGSDAGNPRCFYVYPSDAAAARSYITNLTSAASVQGTGARADAFRKRRQDTLDAMATGDPQAVSHAMRNASTDAAGVSYFEDDPTHYGQGIASNADAIRKATGDAPLSSSLLSRLHLPSLGTMFLAVGLAGAAYVGLTVAGVHVPLPRHLPRLPRHLPKLHLPRLRW